MRSPGCQARTSWSTRTSGSIRRQQCRPSLPSTASATMTRSLSAVSLAVDDGVDERLVVVHNEPNRHKHDFPSTGSTGAAR
jgi:hypothetical protein